MNFDFKAAAIRLLNDAPLTFVLVAGAAALLTRPARQARTLGAVFVGLLVYGFIWKLLTALWDYSLMRTASGGMETDDFEAVGFVWFTWRKVEPFANVVVVLVLAWAVATPRRQVVQTHVDAGDAARDVQPSDNAGPLESGDPLEALMSKKNHPPGPVPPGNRPGGDGSGPDTGAEDIPPQDGTGFAEQDEQRRLGGFTGKGEHSIQQPTPPKDGDAKSKS